MLFWTSLWQGCSAKIPHGCTATCLILLNTPNACPLHLAICWCLFPLDRPMHFSWLGHILVPIPAWQITVFGSALVQFPFLFHLAACTWHIFFFYLYTSLNPFFHLVHLLLALICLLFWALLLTNSPTLETWTHFSCSSNLNKVFHIC